MIRYLIVLLDDTAPSFCHYANGLTVRKLMPLETLRKSVRYAMVHDLKVQFVWPNYQLPDDHLAVIDEVEHTDIRSWLPASDCAHDVVWVFESIADLSQAPLDRDSISVLRISKEALFNSYAELVPVLRRCARLNVVVTDVASFAEPDFERYRQVLEDLADGVEQLYVEGLSPQLNLLTDRMMLSAMKNCGAADTCVTLAPDGSFYACPAFYQLQGGYSLGCLDSGLQVPNAQLYRLDHAPICRVCDAWQCRRCIWLNRSLTLEVNTPSHQQCVMAHIERNASRILLNKIRRHGTFMPEMPTINEIPYLDPFDKIKRW